MKLYQVPTSKTPHIIQHGGKLYITGSEFSELFIHESQPDDQDLNSTFALQETIREKVATPLKVANFRKINWAALEKGPIGQQKSPRHLGILPFGSSKQRKQSLQAEMHFRKERTLSPDLSELSMPNLKRVQPTISPNHLDWINYIPKVRQNLRGLNTNDLVNGQIWPKQQRSITFLSPSPSAASISPMAANDQTSQLQNQRLKAHSVLGANKKVTMDNGEIREQVLASTNLKNRASKAQLQTIVTPSLTPEIVLGTSTIHHQVRLLSKPSSESHTFYDQIHSGQISSANIQSFANLTTDKHKEPSALLEKCKSGQDLAIVTGSVISKNEQMVNQPPQVPLTALQTMKPNEKHLATERTNQFEGWGVTTTKTDEESNQLLRHQQRSRADRESLRNPGSKLNVHIGDNSQQFKQISQKMFPEECKPESKNSQMKNSFYKKRDTQKLWSLRTPKYYKRADKPKSTTCNHHAITPSNFQMEGESMQRKQQKENSQSRQQTGHMSAFLNAKLSRNEGGLSRLTNNASNKSLERQLKEATSIQRLPMIAGARRNTEQTEATNSDGRSSIITFSHPHTVRSRSMIKGSSRDRRGAGNFDFSQCVRDMYLHDNKKHRNAGFIETSAIQYLSRAEKMLEQSKKLKDLLGHVLRVPTVPPQTMEQATTRTSGRVQYERIGHHNSMGTNGQKALDPDSPSIRRTSQLFSGKRSATLTNNYKGLNVRAESYRNLYAKNSIKKTVTKDDEEEIVHLTPLRVEMQLKSEAGGKIRPLPNSFLNKQLVKQSMSPISEGKQTLAYPSPAMRSPAVGNSKKLDFQEDSNLKTVGKDPKLKETKKSSTFEDSFVDPKQSQSRQGGNKDIQPLLQSVYDYFEKEPESEITTPQLRKPVTIFRKDNVNGHVTVAKPSPLGSQLAETEPLVIANSDNKEGVEEQGSRAWEAVKRQDVSLMMIGSPGAETTSPKGISAQSRQSQSTFKVLAKRYNSTKSSNFNKEPKTGNDKMQAKQMQTSLQTIIDSAVGHNDLTRITMENYHGSNMVFAAGTNPNVSLNKVGSSDHQMIASNPTSITDAGNQISEIAHQLIIPAILSKPMLSRGNDDNTQEISPAVFSRQEVKHSHSPLPSSRLNIESPIRQMQNQPSLVTSNKKIFKRGSPPQARTTHPPSPRSPKELSELNMDLQQIDVLQVPKQYTMFISEAKAEQLENYNNSEPYTLQHVYEVDQAQQYGKVSSNSNLHSLHQSQSNGGLLRRNSNSPLPVSVKQKKVELQSIPYQIRMAAIFEKNVNMGPLNQNIKAKKIEASGAIKHRVTRANCCLKPQNPEDVNVMTKAVGSGQQFLENPFQKASIVRLKFLNSNFCQGITEDFMSIQNLDRRIDATIVATDSTFRQYEMYEADEQQLVTRLFKRFFFATIQRKYGYLKANAKDKIEISGRLFMGELELNPRVLCLSGVITTFSEDCYLNWPAFLRIISLFLLRKEVRETRIQFILRWLHLTSAEQLDQFDYIQDRMQLFQFTGRSFRPALPSILNLWDMVRFELLPYSNELFDNGNAHSMNLELAEKIMDASSIEAHQTFDFFNLIFELS